VGRVRPRDDSASRAATIRPHRPNGGEATLAEGWENIIGKVPDGVDVLRIGLRLLTAIFVGGCIGLQREVTHHSAGLRTHILVALGSAVLVIAGSQSAMSSGDVSRIIQGIVTGIGFLGGGAILKLTAEHEIRGLTTAATIWMTAAASVAAGLGRIITSLIALLFTMIVLGVLLKFEKRLGMRERHRQERDLPSSEAVDSDEG
jgi:putative Mg2+ transporter-C (MgtC) family protein